VNNLFCKASADRLKIQIANPESYRSLIHFLKDEGAEFHTYQLKGDKPLRVVIRNLHPTTDPNTIKDELEIRLFYVRCVINVLHKVTKAPLPLFLLTWSHKSNQIIFSTYINFTHKLDLKNPTRPKS
jgi:hypothetical protein